MEIPDLETLQNSLLQGVHVAPSSSKLNASEQEAVSILMNVGNIDRDQRRQSFDHFPRKRDRDRTWSMGSLDTLSEVAATMNMESKTGFGEISFPVARREKPRSASISAILPKELINTYNSAGRIGIYTPEERRRVLEKFHRKRRRRSFAKKIRYNCRKNLADKRIRIKGRFVKLSPEEMEALKMEGDSQRSPSKSENSSSSPGRPRRSSLSGTPSPGLPPRAPPSVSSPPNGQLTPIGSANSMFSPLKKVSLDADGVLNGADRRSERAAAANAVPRAKSETSKALQQLTDSAARQAGSLGTGVGGGKESGEFTASGEVTLGRRRKVSDVEREVAGVAQDASQ